MSILARRSREAGVGFLLEGFALDFELHLAASGFVQLGRHRVDFGAQLGRGFIDQIDGLVGQEPVGNVAVAEDRGGHQARILDADAVMDFVALAQAAEDGNGVFDRRLIDQNGLEAAFESRVLFDVLAIFVERGRADAVQFAAGQHGLEQVAGVHGAFGLAGADDGVQLVDEENDAAFGRLDFLEDGFETLLELAAELGSGDQRAHVERDDLLVFQTFGHVAAHDALGQTFDDGGLADAGLADEHGIVLGAAGQDLDDAADFFVAADDRVELVLRGRLGQIAAVFFESFVGGLGILRGDALRSANFLKHAHQAVAGDAEILEDFFVGGGQDDVFDGDVLVLEALGFVLRRGQQLLQPGGDVDLVQSYAGAGNLGELVEFLDQAAVKVFELAHLARARIDWARPPSCSSRASRRCSTSICWFPRRCGQGLGGAESFLEFFRKAVKIHNVPSS